MRLNEEWGVLAGLRGEYTDVEVSQFTSNIEAGNHYLHFMPSVFVTYKQSEKSTIRFSYSQRIRRPNANELNPFVVYRDEFQVSSGNPDLKPVHTDSFEAGYESRIWQLDANLRAFFRRERDLISERKVFISDTVLLTTRDNDGSSQAGGLEFSLNGKLLPGLTLNTSGNAAYTRIDADQVLAGQNARRSALSLGGRMNLRYQLTQDDQLQVNLNAQGKTLTFQGYREPSATMNVSYRRTVTPALSLVMNVTDIFDTNKNETITDTPLIQDRSFRKADGRVIYLGLSYRIGTGASGPAPGGNRRGPGRS
jgi:outer membrane receptor protein involved in Fe transport